MNNSFLGYIVMTTNRAILFWGHFWHAPIWLPKSNATVRTNLDNDEVEVRATDWICGKNNMEEFRELDNAERD